MTCASDDSDQHKHKPIKMEVYSVFTHWGSDQVLIVSFRGYRMLCVDRADSQDDQSIHWAHISLVRFDMQWLFNDDADFK